MQFRIGHLEDEIMENGELLRPFGPRQIALKFSHIVGTFDAPLSQKGLEFRARNAGEFGRFAERQQAPCIQSQRHLLRHLRLRRHRRQVDFLQNTVGYINCQRHADIIAASAEANKPSTGPRSIERGIYPTSCYRTYSVNASTRPRLRRDTTSTACVSNFLNARGLADCRYYCRSNRRWSAGLTVQILTPISNPCIIPSLTTRRRCFSIESFQQPTTMFSRLRVFFRRFRLTMTK
jgi:hypothetical protein